LTTKEVSYRINEPNEKRREADYKKRGGELHPDWRGRPAVPDEKENQCGAWEKTGEK
jgi:hypothetical protein